VVGSEDNPKLHEHFEHTQQGRNPASRHYLKDTVWLAQQQRSELRPEHHAYRMQIPELQRCKVLPRRYAVVTTTCVERRKEVTVRPAHTSYS
jgi:hypothetical protein